MQLQHEFTVPLPPEQAWEVLLDVETVAPCMPGARVDAVDGAVVTGQVRVKVGPIQVTYRGTATFVETDAAARTVRIEAAGKEARGTGTAKAVVETSLHDTGDGTRVVVETDLAVTGRPAQFGRGVMAEVGAKVIGQFAACLARRLQDPEPRDAPATAGSADDTAAGPGHDQPSAEAVAPPPAAARAGSGGTTLAGAGRPGPARGRPRRRTRGHRPGGRGRGAAA